MLWRVVEACAAVARESGSRIVINDRLDLAVGSGAWGVQLGRRSFPVAAARLILSSGVRIGVSVHDPEEARTAVDAGADFLIAGTLYPSLSHPGAGSTGVQWISAIPGRKPVIGVGGITPERVPEVLTAGAHGVAVIRGVWSSPSPVDAMEEYLAALPG